MNRLSTSLPRLFLISTLVVGPAALRAANAPSKTQGNAAVSGQADRQPTRANVRYGAHERQVLDFYQARSAKPTPVLFVIHGGGWLKGDKSAFNDMAPYLAAGISVVAKRFPKPVIDGVHCDRPGLQIP